MASMTSARKRRFIVPDRTGFGLRCVLCETGTMTGKKTVLSHVNGFWHSNNCFKFDTVERANKARDLYDPRIEKLGLSRWRREVRALLYLYFTSNNNVASDAPPWDRPKSSWQGLKRWKSFHSWNLPSGRLVSRMMSFSHPWTTSTRTGRWS
mmetsp:Transcript_30269/g.54768  ORF Transcript_30269/g.54768 Transcript_30269/m.54768 type:complete len:152 (+) Transcript_30269:401-856(+)